MDLAALVMAKTSRYNCIISVSRSCAAQSILWVCGGCGSLHQASIGCERNKRRPRIIAAASMRGSRTRVLIIAAEAH